MIYLPIDAYRMKYENIIERMKKINCHKKFLFIATGGPRSSGRGAPQRSGPAGFNFPLGTWKVQWGAIGGNPGGAANPPQMTGFTINSNGNLLPTGMMGNGFPVKESDSNDFPKSQGWFTFTMGGSRRVYFYKETTQGELDIQAFSTDRECTMKWKTRSNWCAPGTGKKVESMKFNSSFL